MICVECDRPIVPPRPARINDEPVHVECFPKRLRRFEFGTAEWNVDVSRLLPEEAYHLGKQTVAIIVASRRRTKKRSAG